MLFVPSRLVRTAVLWPVQWPARSQQVARRNALLASTELAERRRELVDVEEFLAHHTEAHAARHVTLEVAVRPA